MDNDDVILDEQQQHVHEKFAHTAWLGDPDHVRQFLIWATYYKRNPHRFCREYLGISLYWYQSLALYLMFRCRLCVFIAARASAKSFLIAVYAVCRAILYPNSRIVITSGVKEQAGLMITEKIRGDLYEHSAMLRREVRGIFNSQNKMAVEFHNGSTIEVVVCSENALGHRSTVNIGEEAKRIKKDIMDKVISPFRIVRQIPFTKLPMYDGDSRFAEEPVEIYISSSIEDTHWLYKVAKGAFQGMLNGDGKFFLATDYSITLRHNIRTRQQMIDDFHKFDPITWAIEYENAVLRENTKAFFSYDMVRECQVLQRAFYPRAHDDVINKIKNRYAIPKQDGEVRIISCDMAFVDRSGNDNSCFSCIRLLPDTDAWGHKFYKVQVPYLEAIKGQEYRRQAIRIQQLKSDFDGDYIVLDGKNGGSGIYDLLARVLYDDSRGVEYGALRCMNDDVFASRVNNPDADPCVFVVNASAKLNSDIANNFRMMLSQHQVELLIPRDEAVETLAQLFPDYIKTNDPEKRLWYEKPYLEGMLAMAEIVNLQYELGESTGIIKIKEQSGWTKDRYTSISYGAYFAILLSRDLLNDDEGAFEDAPILVSTISF